MHAVVLSGIRPSFPSLSRSAGQITHVLLTRSPLEHLRRDLSVRLACVKHAASVRPEPESNSPNKTPKRHIQKNLTQARHQKLASQTTTPQTGKKGAAKKQQQTKTTKHTIEFSNNTP